MTRTTSIGGTEHPRYAEILTPDALAFLAQLDGAFAGRRADLLHDRRDRAMQLNAGGPLPDFRPETADQRAADWQVASPAPGLTRRRVEITGPATPTMTINALNSGADVWMADLEDATAPTWQNVIGSQLALFDAIRGTLEFDANGKHYAVKGSTPTIVLRPRGWHLCEKQLLIDGRPLSAALVDFGLYFYHNANELIERGAGPYFYLPKLESAEEAKLWNDVFVLAQDLLGIEKGTIRATVLVETLPAAFAMDEILFELKEHSAGLNAGRWDYIFSYIKTLGVLGPEYVLPQRDRVTMTAPFLRAYTELLVATCHRRGAHAIGGMAAFVPDKRDPEAAEAALAKVTQDKTREAGDGFDGSWVAHPGLVANAGAAFEAVLGDADDQRSRQRPEVSVSQADLLAAPEGGVSLGGVASNVSVALRYLARWIGGTGAVAIDNLMEDAATVEISRAQLWQWITNGSRLTEGPKVTHAMVAEMIEEETERLIGDGQWGTPEQLRGAREVLQEMSLQERLPSFFTPYAYVRYLTEPAYRLTGDIRPEDLRMSEQVPGHGDDADDGAAA